jgi:hypothetical protein
MGSGGSFVAILLSVPLTAVALVGFIGVPKLQEIVSSATSRGDDDLDGEGFSSRSKSKRGSSKADRFADEDADPWGDESTKDALTDDDFSGKSKTSKSSKSALSRLGRTKPGTEDRDSALADDKTDDLYNRAPRGRFGQTPREPDAIEPAASNPFSSRGSVATADFLSRSPATGGTGAGRSAAGSGFVTAIEKLRAVGIERYRLEPGLTAGQFLFVCQANPVAGDPAIHRFEAEANDPAAAVEDVLKQVGDWKATAGATRTALESRR